MNPHLLYIFVKIIYREYFRRLGLIRENSSSSWNWRIRNLVFTNCLQWK